MGTKQSTTFLTRQIIQQKTGFGGYIIPSSESVALTASRVGTELPNYRQKILLGQDATTALTASRATAFLQNGSVRFTDPDQGGHEYYTNKCGFTFTQVVPGGVPGSLVSQALATALSKYYGKLSDLRAPLKGQSFVGEIGKTIKMLRQPFKEGTDMIISVFRKSPKRLSKAIGSSWLQLRFGLLPLISDVSEIVEMTRLQATRQNTESHRCYGAAQSSNTVAWTGSDIYGMNLSGTIEYTYKAESIIRFGYKTVLLDETEARLNSFQQSFLQLRDIPDTIWELTPWSFLFDYFINIGQIIEATTASQANVVWVSQSSVKTATAKLNIRAAIPVSQSFKLVSFIPTVYQYKLRSVERTTAPPGIPPVVFSLPHSDVRLANIAALLTGFLRS